MVKEGWFKKIVKCEPWITESILSEKKNRHKYKTGHQIPKTKQTAESNVILFK